MIERGPISGPGNSNNNSQPPLAGRRSLTTRTGAEGKRWEVSQEEGSLRSYILGRPHVLPRQPLKWLHLISMVLITSVRKPSIRGSCIKQTNPICTYKIDWFCTIPWKVNAHMSYHFQLIFTHLNPWCHNYCYAFWIKMYQWDSHKISKYLLTKQEKLSSAFTVGPFKHI